jgi:FSR family fosmidomycin resistance protein-like MFS transporter
MALTANRPGLEQAKVALRVLASISVCHFLNDVLQSVIPSVYPILKTSYGLDFGQIGLITLTNQITASLLQPAVGLYTDRRPTPYSLPVGMALSLCGILLLSAAPSFPAILCAVALVGMGSAVFHPESSRIARMASGGRHGFAQSVFAVGGNAGAALGPLAAAFVVVPSGQRGIAWFALAALAGIAMLARVSAWSKGRRTSSGGFIGGASGRSSRLSPRQVRTAMGVLVALVFSKYFYLVSLTSFFTFFLMSRFHVSLRVAQVHLFLFLGAVAAGSLLGGTLSDRVGGKYVIWFSILGVFPFTLLLPYAGLFWTGALSVVIGLILASAFPAIIVYGQELVPGKVGAVSGLFYGLAFGMGGVGAAALGKLADATSIGFVYHVCSFLPLLGLLAAFLPNLERRNSEISE